MAAGHGVELSVPDISPGDYLGEVESICDSALRMWEALRDGEKGTN
jgi:hypothetical protein